MIGLPSIIVAVSDLVREIIQRKFPNATEVEKAKLALLASELDVELKTMSAQMRINEIEAGSPHFFVAGARPAALWVCVGGLFYTVTHPLLVWASSLLSIQAPPVLDTGHLNYILGGLLGLGGMRSFDKLKGIDTKRPL